MAATKENLPTDFEDEILEDQLETPAPKDENGVPYCLKHHCRMKQTSGGKKGAPAAYYQCPVDGCSETAKRIKTNNESSIPAEPQFCPRCSKGKDSVVLERSQKNSTPYYSILICSHCSFKSSPMPRPEFVAAQKAARRTNVEDIGSR